MTDRPLILPPLRRTAKDAEAFARVVHEGHVDKAGRPYIEHLERVARDVWREMVRWNDYAHDDPRVDEAVQVAWLHDAPEDNRCTVADLLREGFCVTVVRDVAMLDRNNFDPDDTACATYQGWIDYLAETGSLAVILGKIADIEDHLDPPILAGLPADEQASLGRRYRRALPILKHAAVRLGWRQGHG